MDASQARVSRDWVPQDSADPRLAPGSNGRSSIIFGADSAGAFSTATDPASNSRKTYLDAVGRLAQVIEDPTGLNYSTTNSYSALDDLIGVAQGSLAARSFTPSSLKRLVNATNPEAGLISYTYDANGNVLTKTDALSKVTTMTYDALNREITKSFSDSTPTASYCCDGLPDSSQVCPSSASSTLHGRMTQVKSSAGYTQYTAFDDFGRVLNSQQNWPASPTTSRISTILQATCCR